MFGCCCVFDGVVWCLFVDMRKALSRCYCVDVVVRCLRFVMCCCLLVVGWRWLVVD